LESEGAFRCDIRPRKRFPSGSGSGYASVAFAARCSVTWRNVDAAARCFLALDQTGRRFAAIIALHIEAAQVSAVAAAPRDVLVSVMNPSLFD
jgi:hypothetical protein